MLGEGEYAGDSGVYGEGSVCWEVGVRREMRSMLLIDGHECYVDGRMSCGCRMIGGDRAIWLRSVLVWSDTVLDEIDFGKVVQQGRAECREVVDS